MRSGNELIRLCYLSPPRFPSSIGNLEQAAQRVEQPMG
jgi:hypothetical protein